MTGKELVLAAMACRATDRTPWVPFVGCHAGALVGIPADRYLRSADAIVSGVAEAVRRYRPDGIPVVFDLQVEAEALGCKLAWSEENPPAVISHPLTEGIALDSLAVPGESDGRIGLCIEAARQLRSRFPDIAAYGLITGPFTLALHLVGTDIFLKMFEDPVEVGHILEFCTQVAKAMAGRYAQAGCDVIAVVDPMTSQIGPDQFVQFVQTSETAVFSHIRSLGKRGSFFVCGPAQQNIGVMCSCGPDNVSVDENIALDYVKEICLPRSVSFGGNMRLTTVLLLGTAQESMREAVLCMDAGGGRGFILAPGCDLPYGTPAANLEAVAVAVHDPYQREVARALQQPPAPGAVVPDMRRYGETGRVQVDIITLDSESCAPCQYMVEAVKTVAPLFGDAVAWREHKIKNPEGIALMQALGVRNVPTTCIDGSVAFVGRIPSRDELAAAIRARISAKGQVA